jgi:membrane protease YdiL (CAAX protease family)
MAEASPAYPVSFSVDYPDRNLNRLTTFFRIFTIIPIGVVIALLAGGGTGSGYDASGVSYQYAAGGIVVLPLILMILFRQKYPPLVVRLEPATAQVWRPCRSLLMVTHRRISFYG